jgi:hypothetical protein
MSWRDAVPHAGAGLGRGLEYRPRLSAGPLIQQSNCNARLGALDGASCFSRSAGARVPETSKADEHHHPSRGFRRGDFVDIGRPAPATTPTARAARASDKNFEFHGGPGDVHFSDRHGAVSTGQAEGIAAALPSARSDDDKRTDNGARECEELNASGVTKETTWIAIIALNDNVPCWDRVAAWFDGDVLREQTTDIRAAAAASAAAAPSAARIAAASAAASHPAAAAAAIPSRIYSGAGAAGIGRGAKAAYAATCTGATRAIANQTAASATAA